MHFLLDLLLNAAILFILASVLKGVKIKNYGTAIWVALVIGFLNATVGFALRLPLNIITLGLLSVIVRIVVSAIMIKLADLVFPGFTTKGWLPAIIIAVCMVVAGTLFANFY